MPFLEGVRKGDYPMAVLDDKARRNLRVMFVTHAMDGRAPGSINTPEHQATARSVAEEAIVLLKNDGAALPLDATKFKSLAIIGDNATRLQCHGGQSSEIKAFYEITPLEGILRRIGHDLNVTYSVGFGKGVAADAGDRAVQAAKDANVALVIAGLNHDRNADTEGSDRRDLKLPYGQDELIRRIVEANPRTIVVIVAGSPVEMGSWLGRAPAVVQAWYSGMEGGNALARVLFGDVNPSGKLPCTFPKQLADSPAHALNAYPGTNGTVRYEEGLLVGYRWFNTKQIEPLFPFGFGLSYTTFEYSNLKLVAGQDTNGPAVTAEFEITNTGSREGAEVAQLYVHQVQPGLPQPVKELKGFRKVFLKPNEKQTVSIPLDRKAFAYYDPAKAGWLAEKGAFTILVGGSSRDIRLQDSFQLAQTTVEK